jgi:hypothetical protein
VEESLLSKLTLENYRSYGSAVIDFGVVTGIIGLNNHGKTSVYRALSMILSNGDFRTKDIRHGTKHASVEVEFLDGSKIRRERTASTQKLIVTTADGQVLGPYAKVSDMDEVVQGISGVRPVNLTKGEAADYIQLVGVDSPQNFLVGGVNPATVLKRINKLAGGAGLETTKQKLMSQLKAMKTNSEFLEREHQQAESELAELDAIDFEQLGAIKEELSKLIALYKANETYESVLLRFEREVEALQPFEHLVEQNIALSSIILDLEPLVNEYYQLDYEFRLIEVNEEQVKNLLTELAALEPQQITLQQQINELEGKVKEEQLENARKQAEEQARQEQERKTAQLKFVNTCPVCNRPMENNA